MIQISAIDNFHLSYSEIKTCIDAYTERLRALAPYIGLSVLLAAVAVTVVYVKKRKK